MKSTPVADLLVLTDSYGSVLRNCPSGVCLYQVETLDALNVRAVRYNSRTIAFDATGLPAVTSGTRPFSLSPCLHSRLAYHK